MSEKAGLRKGKIMDMNRVIKIVIYAAATFAVITGVNYISFMVRNVPVDFNWAMIGIEAAALGVIFAFGPDAAQRKKNREKLVKRFTGR